MVIVRARKPRASPGTARLQATTPAIAAALDGVLVPRRRNNAGDDRVQLHGITRRYRP